MALFLSRLSATLMSTPVSRPLLMRSAALHATRMQEADWGFDSGARPPSEKQIQFAQRLAQQTATELPQGVFNNGFECSQFIDEALSKVPPTDKQIEFARTIAANANIELPDHAIASSKSISAYIEANKGLAPMSPGMGGGGSGGTGPPTPKQITFAAKLAQQLNIGIPAEVLQSKSAMSSFIDQSLSQTNSQPQGGVGGMDGPWGGGGGPAGGGGGGGFAAGTAMGAAASDLFSGAGAPAGGAYEPMAAPPSRDDEDLIASESVDAIGLSDVDEAAEALDDMFAEARGGDEDETSYVTEKTIPF